MMMFTSLEQTLHLNGLPSILPDSEREAVRLFQTYLHLLFPFSGGQQSNADRILLCSRIEAVREVSPSFIPKTLSPPWRGGERREILLLFFCICFLLPAGEPMLFF
jgi:hypothetical protein